MGIEENLGHKFNNEGLLRTALTHSSYANENKNAGDCNERLEFLGDAVLGIIVAKYLYINYPQMAEGKMTRLRAELVCEKSLREVAEKIKLGDFLLLGKGEEIGGGRYRSSILADAVEAVLGAIYLDGGMEEAEKFINKFIISLYEAGECDFDRDYKTELQEFIQKKSGQVLEYVAMDESGPEHAKEFTVGVRLNGKYLSSGVGKSKKAAEQEAAKTALSKLK